MGKLNEIFVAIKEIDYIEAQIGDCAKSIVIGVGQIMYSSVRCSEVTAMMPSNCLKIALSRRC